MKQYVIINNELKMSKGKIARMCVGAGHHIKSVSNIIQRIKWVANGFNTVVLKSDIFEGIVRQLETYNIKHFVHVDAGFTQVETGSKCMVTFLCKEEDYILFSELKLY